MRKILVGSGAILLAALSVGAAIRGRSMQDVVFMGRVLDAAGGQPLSGARVVLDGAAHGTLSDAGGRYHLAVPTEGFRNRRVVLAASLLGYERAEAAVRVTADTVRTDLRLRATTRAAAVARHAASHPHRPPGWNTESYGLIEENPFLAAARNPLSTFSIDVDRASYSNIRRT